MAALDRMSSIPFSKSVNLSLWVIKVEKSQILLSNSLIVCSKGFRPTKLPNTLISLRVISYCVTVCESFGRKTEQDYLSTSSADFGTIHNLISHRIYGNINTKWADIK